MRRDAGAGYCVACNSHAQGLRCSQLGTARGVESKAQQKHTGSHSKNLGVVHPQQILRLSLAKSLDGIYIFILLIKSLDAWKEEAGAGIPAKSELGKD